MEMVNVLVRGQECKLIFSGVSNHALRMYGEHKKVCLVLDLETNEYTVSVGVKNHFGMIISGATKEEAWDMFLNITEAEVDARLAKLFAFYVG